MSLWEILVFGSIRLARDANYDQLEFDANFNSLIRKLVGISDFADNKKKYPLQTLKDNIGLLDEKTLDEINEIIVKTGHCLKKNEELNVKVDTYVLETNVHFPTDLNLLWDAGRKSIDIIAHIIKDSTEDFGWRKHHDWRKRLKVAYHNAAKRTVGQGRNTSRGLDAVAKRIVDEIVETMPSGLRCPTAADILRLGAKIAPPRCQPDRACPRCHGIGYITSDWLCTEEPMPDGSVRKTRERITEPQAFALGRQIGAAKASRQMVYSTAERCGCAA